MKNELKDLTPQETEYIIVNLQNSDQSGSHWTAVIRQKNKNYYACSFGSDPPLEVQDYLGKNILSSTFQIQQFDESCCGEYSLLIIYLVRQGIPFEHAILSLVEE